MSAIASAKLISELEVAIQGGSPGRRSRMLREVTRLFLLIESRLDHGQIAVFGDVMVRLVDGSDPGEHAWLGAALCKKQSAPGEVIGLLARHEEATVAAPVLLNSESVSDNDLVEVANHRGQQHLLAIARRKALTEAVTDALLGRDDVTVCRALARNAGARFSDRGCLKLAAAAELDAALADALAVRPEMPVKALHDMLSRRTRSAPITVRAL